MAKIVSSEFFSTAIFRVKLRKIRKQRDYIGAGEKQVIWDNKEAQGSPRKARDGEEDMGLREASRTEGLFTKTGLKAVNEKNEEVLKRTRMNGDLCLISLARQPASCFSSYRSFLGLFIHSFCSVFYFRPMASSKASSPQTAI